MLDRQELGTREPTLGIEVAPAPPVQGDALRIVDFPLVTVSAVVDNEEDVADEFAAWLAAGGFLRPFVVTSKHGGSLVRAIRGSVGIVVPADRANQAWALSLASAATQAGADCIVAAGGGRCIDVAKVSAAESGLPLVAAPTQVSHDGICSPVAVVPKAGGLGESLTAVAPTAAFFSLPTLSRSPLASIQAGLGDLISNPFALKDWDLAQEVTGEKIKRSAWHLAMESYQLIQPLIEVDLGEDLRLPKILGRLSHALANSGLAMMRAGSSRPASGAEHKISHAIDATLGGRALHGQQVAFGSMIAASLHGEDVDRLRGELINVGLPHHPRHLGLSHEDLVQLIVTAPRTRPGRFTVLEHLALSEAGAGRVIRSIWATW